jgi:hypothetical protein
LIASVPFGPSGSTAIVSGGSAGSALITYTSPAGCRGITPIDVDPLPMVFNVIGGGAYCPGGSGVNIGLDNSELGVEYQLFCGTTPIGPPVPGSGAAITFGLQTAVCCYNVIARFTASLTHCTNTMAGSACVSLHTQPAITWPWLCSGSTLNFPTPALVGTYALGTTTPGTSINPVTGEIICGAPGTITIDYADPATGCVWTYGPLTIHPTPTPTIDNSPKDLCVGEKQYMYGSPAGGTWSSSDASVADFNPLVPNEVIGMGHGTATITYSFTAGGCVGIATWVINVHPNPVITLTSIPGATGTPPVILMCDDATLTATTDLVCNFTWTPTMATTFGSTTSSITVHPSVVTTYSVIVNDVLHGCTATAGIIVQPVPNTCVCEALHSTPAIPVASFGTSGTISTAGPVPAPGNYYMANDVAFTGAPGTTIALVNCIIFIDPNKEMTVAPGVRLVLDHCHLFCCHPDMWRGIELLSAGGLQGTIELINSTMIEDAEVAINVTSPVTPLGYLPGGVANLIINSSGAIFNKNIVGIQVHTYTPPMLSIPGLPAITDPNHPVVATPCYPFVIENTVFTSRNFYNFSNTPGGSWSTSYPDTWPFNWATTAQLKAPIAAGPYDPPFNIGGAASCANGPCPPSQCNIPVWSTLPVDADKGIEVVTVGAVTGAGAGNEVYSGFVAGSIPVNGTERNTFDHLNYGIYAENSDVTVRNSVFIHMNGTINPSYGGDGIFAMNTNPPGLDNRYKLHVYGSDASGLFGLPPTVSTSCDFYDCINGVEAWEYYHVKAEFTNMFSNHSSMLLTNLQGRYGFLMNSSRYFNVQLNFNNIVNITNGIKYYINPAMFTPPFHGQISINDNRISATNFAGPITANEYVRQGIYLQCATTAGGFGWSFPASQINIDRNQMNRVLKGIRVEDVEFQDQPVTVNNNTLTLERSLLPAAAGIGKQTGILIERVNPALIQENTIIGPGHANPVPPSYAGNPYTPNMIEGIRIDQLTGIISLPGFMSTLSTVGCNTTNDINTGFYIKGLNGINWITNTMNQNAYGMVLEGTMGPQGGPGQICFNRWLPLGGFWTAMSGPHYQTYTRGTANPTISPLYVSTTAAENPINNGTEAPTLTPYSIGGFSIFTTASAPPTCPALAPSPIAFRHANGDTIDAQNPAVTNMLNGQSYSLYPNPSDGHITLKQQLADTKPVSVAILNATGQQVYSGEMLFENGTSAFDMNNKVPGLYLLQVKDSKGEQFNIKFIIK